MASPSIRPFSVLLLCLFHGFSLAKKDLNHGGLLVGGVQAAWPFPGDGSKGGHFVGGGGHVEPRNPNNPGLIPDLNPNDYIAYLCSIGYTDAQVAAVSRQAVKCADFRKILPVGLDHPILSLSLKAGEKISISRNVTNLGCASSTYRVEVSAPPGVSVAVSPAQLTFSSVKETKQYTVTMARLKDSGPGILEGALTWTAGAGETTVRSPIVVNLL